MKTMSISTANGSKWFLYLDSSLHVFMKKFSLFHVPFLGVNFNVEILCHQFNFSSIFIFDQ